MAKSKKTKELKIDFGCGSNKREGFYGVDTIKFPNVDLVLDLRKKWPWKDNSVDEAHASHFIEHLEAPERIHFFNELYRVMKEGTTCQIITPHWSSIRAYGDLTHKWPPVSEFFWYYLDKNWRKANAPHTPLTCDFEATWGYNLHPDFVVRSQESQTFGLTYYKEVAQDMICTVKKRKK